MLIALKDVNKCSQQPVCNKANLLHHYIDDKIIFVSSYTVRGLPCNIKVYYVTLINRSFYSKIGTSLVIISKYFLFLHVNIFFIGSKGLEICTYITVTYVAFFYIHHLSVIKALYEFKLLAGINCCHLKAHLCEIW